MQPEQVDAVTATDLLTYCRSAHTPQRMVLAGSGVDHDRLVDMARKHFVGKTPVWEEHQGLSDVPLDQSVAQYTGGILKVSDAPPVSAVTARDHQITRVTRRCRQIVSVSHSSPQSAVSVDRSLRT